MFLRILLSVSPDIWLLCCDLLFYCRNWIAVGIFFFGGNCYHFGFRNLIPSNLLHQRFLGFNLHLVQQLIGHIFNRLGKFRVVILPIIECLSRNAHRFAYFPGCIGIGTYHCQYTFRNFLVVFLHFFLFLHLNFYGHLVVVDIPSYL